MHGVSRRSVFISMYNMYLYSGMETSHEARTHRKTAVRLEEIHDPGKPDQPATQLESQASLHTSFIMEAT